MPLFEFPLLRNHLNAKQNTSVGRLGMHHTVRYLHGPRPPRVHRKSEAGWELDGGMASEEGDSNGAAWRLIIGD